MPARIRPRPSMETAILNKNCVETVVPLDIAHFIATHLRVESSLNLPEIQLYKAHSGSQLHRLDPDAAGGGPPPYWAFDWAGGIALARHILDHAHLVAGLRVLDVGSGSGLVAIAAAKAGAARSIAIDIDANAMTAIGLNAALNGVCVATEFGDPLNTIPEGIDLVLIGDLFYEMSLSVRVLAFAERCRSVGIDVLIGDPDRTHLPRQRLARLADYPATDFGGGSAPIVASVYALA